MEDIEIDIIESFDNPRDVDWDELQNWKTEDYINYGCTLDKYYEIIGERRIINNYEWKTYKGKIGISRTYKFNCLIYQSSYYKNSNDNNYRAGKLEYLSHFIKYKNKEYEYCHNFHSDGSTRSIGFYDCPDILKQKNVVYKSQYDFNGQIMTKTHYNENGTIKKKYIYKKSDFDDLNMNNNDDNNFDDNNINVDNIDNNNINNDIDININDDSFWDIDISNAD
jgi:hypothetical protein